MIDSGLVPRHTLKEFRKLFTQQLALYTLAEYAIA